MMTYEVNPSYIEPTSCYIAGPMTGIAEFNFPEFDAAKRWLKKKGWDVISPADLDRLAGFDESGATGHEALSLEMRQEFARRDLNAILNVDTVFLLPNWYTSTGATHEKKVAEWLGHAVYELVRNEAGAWSAEPVEELAEAWSGSAESPTEDATMSDVWDANPQFSAEFIDYYDEQIRTHTVPPDAWTGVAGTPEYFEEHPLPGYYDTDDTSDWFEEHPLPDAPPPFPPEVSYNNREWLLATANQLVNGDRNVQYGDPNDDFSRTAAMWSAWKGVEFEAWEVAVFMGLLKTSRLRWNPQKSDSWIDLAGYTACGWDCVPSKAA